MFTNLEGRPLRKELLVREVIALQKIMGHYHVRMTEELYGQHKISDAQLFEVEPV